MIDGDDWCCFMMNGGCGSDRVNVDDVDGVDVVSEPIWSGKVSSTIFLVIILVQLLSALQTRTCVGFCTFNLILLSKISI